VPGVVRASVGYTGSTIDIDGDGTGTGTGTGTATPTPTYKSVCKGDGNTEAVRIEYDPSILKYEHVIRRFVESPKVPNIYGEQDLQYQVAIWVHSKEQRMTAQNVCEDVCKNIPILDVMPWFDAEDSHQNFFGQGWK